MLSSLFLYPLVCPRVSLVKISLSQEHCSSRMDKRQPGFHLSMDEVDYGPFYGDCVSRGYTGERMETLAVLKCNGG